jgi:hypothetical protein
MLQLTPPSPDLRLAANQSASTPGLTAAGAAAGPSSQASAGGVLWTLSDVVSRPDEFRKLFTREVLSGKQAMLAGVVMLEAPVDAAHPQVRGQRGAFRYAQQQGKHAVLTRPC